MQDESYKYWAFISYSHHDRAWAAWLHRALEAYRVPRRLVGRDSAAGPLPRRLFPVFRDREELPSSSNLGVAIDQALQQSRHLIVIASPYAAVSQWVDQEIARFRALGRGNRIYCLIVDGEPRADLQPNKGFLECFPPALRAIGGVEPIAADVRPGKDGKAAAKLKLAAGLLGVGLDELRRRERRGRLLRNLGWTAAGLLTVAVLAGVWTTQQRGKQAALAQQALQAHIRTVYEKGRQELLEHNQARAAVYLNEAYRLGVDTPALRFMLARAMRIVDAQRLSFQTGGPVAGLCLSPDSKLIASVGAGRIIKVWSLADRRKLFEFPLPPGPAGLRFSRDSRLIYILVMPDGAPHGLIGVWDVATGSKRAEPQTVSIDTVFNPFDRDDRHVAYVTPGHAAAIMDLQSGQVVKTIPGDYSVAGFSRDGLRFFTGAETGEVAVWDHAAAHRLRTLDGLASPIHEIDDTEDGKLIAAAARDGNIRMWQAADGRLRMMAGHPSPNPGLVFSEYGDRLLTSADDGGRVWNTKTGQLEYVKQSLLSNGDFAIGAYGRWILEDDSGRLAMRDIRSGIELYTFDAHQGEHLAYDNSEDDLSLATAGGDGRVVLWNIPAIADAELRHAVDPVRWAPPVVRPPPAAVAFSPDGKLMATGAADGTLKLWDVATQRLERSIEADPRGVDAIAFSEDGARIVTGGFADGIKLWDAASGAQLLRLDTDGRNVYTVALSRDGSVIAAAAQGGSTRLWATNGGEQLASFQGDGAGEGAFSPDGGSFLIGVQGEVRLWDLRARRFAWTTKLKDAETVDALAFSRDGKAIAAGFGKGAALLDAATGKILHDIAKAPADEFISAAFSPDGRSVVLGDGDGGALLWWPGSGAYRTIEGHAGGLRSAAFSPDGQFVLTSGRDGTARLWDAGTGEMLDTIGEMPSPIPEVPYRAASLSPDGKWALVGSTDGVFRLWGLSEETRSARELSAVLRCRVPWQLNGDNLQPAAPQEAGCAH